MPANEQALIAKVGYPQDAIPVNASTTGNAAGSSCSLPGVANRTTYLTKAIITSSFVSTICAGIITITDGTWSLSAILVETVTAGGFMHLDFADAPLVASGTNTAITVTVPAIGNGTTTTILLVGYQR
jgi:hypothetical protein